MFSATTALSSRKAPAASASTCAFGMQAYQAWQAACVQGSLQSQLAGKARLDSEKHGLPTSIFTIANPEVGT